jgi:hypothetical protein
MSSAKLKRAGKPAPKANGRPKFVPTHDQRVKVETMAAYGVPQQQIAKEIGIDPTTLRERFRYELDMAEPKMLSMVTQSLFQKAIGNGPSAVTAAIFILKARAGWRDTPQMIEIGGAGGGPIAIEIQGDKRLKKF